MEKKYPFKFLDSYNQNDTEMFFGRDEEIVALYEMVFQNSILLVYGASGTGKTSLIQCGLAGRFKSYDWLSLTIRRGTNINAALEKALIDAGGDDLDEEETLSKDSSTKLSRLLQLIKGVYLNSFKPIYLIFDQFEELYILGTKDEQEKFIEAVKEILKAEQPVKMIFSIREEYLGHLFEFEKEVPQLLRKKLRVEPMTLNKVTDVIKGINSFTLSNVRIKADEIDAITQGIFERLRGKKKTLTIQLPYLQVFLDKLYLETTKDETRKADALIELNVLNRIGDIGDVLRNFLEEQVTGISKKLSRADRKVNPETIWKILSPFSTLEGTKEPISKKELGERLKDIDKKLIDEAVESFVNSRILNFSEGANLYELAHDSLALRIAEKRSDEEISLLEVRRLIKNQVSLKQDAKELFSKKQLNFIEPHLNKLNLSEQESQLIAESKEAIHKAERKVKIRRRRVLITIAAAAIFVIGSLTFLLYLSSIARNKNKLLLSNNYWNNSKSEKAENDYVYALSNAAEAIDISGDTILAKKILIDIEHQWPLVTLNNIISDQSQITMATYSADDSTTIVTVSKDFIIRKWDAKTGKLLSWVALEAKAWKNSVKAQVRSKNDLGAYYEIINFTPDGKKIIHTDTNGFLRLSLVKDGKNDPTFSRFDSIHYDRGHPPSFNRDGTNMIMHYPLHNEFSLFGSDSERKITLPDLYSTKNPFDNYYATITNLVFNRTSTKFLFLVDGKRIFIGNTKTEDIQELKLELKDLATNPEKNEVTSPVFAAPTTKRNSQIGTNHAKVGNKKYYGAILNRISFYGAKDTIITASKDSSVRFWNASTGQQIGEELIHQAPVQLAFLIPNSNRLFTRDEDGSTNIWEDNGKRLGHAVKLEPSTQRVRFRSDGTQVMVVENNSVFLWNLLQNDYSGNKVLTIEDLPNAVFSPDLKKIVIPDTINNALVFRLLNSETRSQIGRNMQVEKKADYDFDYVITYGEKVFSPDSKKLLTEINDRSMMLWDLEKQTQIGKTILSQNVAEHSASGQLIWTLPIFSPDSKKLLVFNNDTTVQVMNAETGKKIGKKIPFVHPYENLIDWHIVFSADSSKILTHKFYFEYSEETQEGLPPRQQLSGISSAIQLWNLETGKQIGEEIKYQRPISQPFIDEINLENDAIQGGMKYSLGNLPPAFSPDGKSFITFFKYNSICQIWDAEKRTQIGDNIEFTSQWVPNFTYDGKSILAAVNDSIVRYIDAETGKPTSDSIKHWSAVTSPIISPNNKWILTFPKNGAIRLLNAKTKKEVRENADFKHQSAYTFPCFSPDGKQFITTDQSGFLRIWNAETGKQKGPAMKYRSSKVKEMAFSPDGKKILSKFFNENAETGESFFHTAVIWDAENGKQIREAFLLEDSKKIKSSIEGELIAIEYFDPQVIEEPEITELRSIETGDLDIPADLLKLQVYMVSGYKFDFETNEKIPLTPEEFKDIKKEYDLLALKHFRTCRYYNYNFWKHFNEDEAKKIRVINVWGKKTFNADQFTILPAFQIGDTTQKENNGSFLAPNQAIVSKNGEYLLAYQKDGDLVIYKKEGMEPIWSSQTFGSPAYKTVMQFDGNLVIYSGDPGSELGNRAIWSSDTWENNANAKLVLEDDGNLVIYNTQNKIVWQSKTNGMISK